MPPLHTAALRGCWPLFYRFVSGRETCQNRLCQSFRGRVLIGLDLKESNFLRNGFNSITRGLFSADSDFPSFVQSCSRRGRCRLFIAELCEVVRWNILKCWAPLYVSILLLNTLPYAEYVWALFDFVSRKGQWSKEQEPPSGTVHQHVSARPRDPILTAIFK